MQGPGAGWRRRPGAGGAREDIQARLRRAQEVMETVTWTNRTQRIRQPRNFYQAGTKEREKGPGRGRRDR